MPARIGASSFGESRLRMLRIVRRGDRHDPRDLIVSCRFEGDFAAAFHDGRTAAVIPGEAMKNLVHSTAQATGDCDIEVIGMTVCERMLAANPGITRVRVELAETPWMRLESGGKPQGQAFMASSGERRTAAVTSNGERLSVVSGIEDLMVMRSSGFAPPRTTNRNDGTEDLLAPLLVGALMVRWTYSTPDVTFGPFRQGIRSAVIETFVRHQARSVQQLLYAIADVVLASYAEILDVTLAMHERPYRPADLFGAGIENPDELYVAADEPLGIVEVTVERDSNGASSS
jgi:urate oxidase